MKINSKILHIPPYLTTSWAHVIALTNRDQKLLIILSDGQKIEIPNLPQDVLELIYTTYAEYIEKDKIQSQYRPNPNFLQAESMGQLKSMGKFSFNALDPSGASIQHNPAESNMPDFPPEVLEKISAIAKIISPEDVKAIPVAEPHCNCPHCQITRAIRKAIPYPIPDALEVVDPEEVVPTQDLHFQQWDIKQTGDNLYDVINRLDTNEIYHVFLGTPVCCTCGSAGCDHILAVLKS